MATIKQWRRAVDLNPLDVATIRAGLLRLPCPEGASKWTHYGAEFVRSRKDEVWPKVEAVFRGLPREERRAIVQRRRVWRKAVEVAESRRDWSRRKGGAE
jgi:hypothetical protein